MDHRVKPGGNEESGLFDIAACQTRAHRAAGTITLVRPRQETRTRGLTPPP
jgi:hypothetical protein